MITKTCGCSTETCGCCEGTQKLTPMFTVNRPGLDKLLYRVGIHGAFFETMKARLANMTVEAPGADGQTIESFQPLLGLTTRESSDPAIALLDCWATVGDVLTFYQERIANEGYLHTATERRSILELARLVGYTLRPGVASTVFLAYTLEDKQLVPVEIPAGARSQSIPGPGELPQSFETSEDLIARSEWNNLQIRLKRPQNITLETALTIPKIYVAGTDTNLKTGDSLLLVFGDHGKPAVMRTITKLEAQFESGRTVIVLQPVAPFVLRAVSAILDFMSAVAQVPSDDPDIEISNAILALKKFLGVILSQVVAQLYLGTVSSIDAPLIETFIEQLERMSKSLPVFGESVSKLLESLRTVEEEPATGPRNSVDITSPAQFVDQLLKLKKPQAATSLQLSRSLAAEFRPGADLHAQLLVNFAPRLKDTFYSAWSNANVKTTPPALKAIYAFRVEAPLFGANVPKQPSYYQDDEKDSSGVMHRFGELKPQSEWTEWDLEGDETENGLFLDQVYDGIPPASYVVVQQISRDMFKREISGEMFRRDVKEVLSSRTIQRTAYGISGKTTQLVFADGWWTGVKDSMKTLRSVLVFGQSEKLTLIEEPINEPVELGKENMNTGIELAQLYNEITSGRWVIFSGERTDIGGVTGVKASELLMISGLRQDYDPNLPGDKTHTTLLLATPTAYAYKRDTLTIYGNVVKATHGETRKETLGSGDGSQALQSFALKQPPLTFIPAPNPKGVDSTLKVYVNDVQWHETDTLAGLGPKDRKFTTKADDDNKTSVIFGNGREGARLPTGVENLKAEYRNGIGKPGNVLAEQVSLLQTRPLGVKSVINPLRASGGADKESRDQARENAPLAVMSLDRLVSVQDYADFTRTFAGIDKAAARRLSDGRRELVHVTIACADDIPIDPVSDLYRNLLIALHEFGDIDLPVQVDLRELLVLVLSANVRLQPDYQWDPVVQAIQGRLLERFGFDKRALGQPALLCEIIAAIQNTDGVAYVDVDAFGGIPEKIADADGTRRLLTLDELALAAKMVVYSAYRYLLFQVDDFQDLEGLVKKLSDADDRGPVSDFLWNQFSSETKKLLSNGQSTPQQQRAALIKELNKVLLGDSIYDTERFRAAPLSPEIAALLKQKVQGGDLLRLNRLLLESAYSTEIAKSQDKLQQVVPSGPGQRVDANLADFENGALRPAQLAVFMPAVPETIVLNQIK